MDFLFVNMNNENINQLNTWIAEMLLEFPQETSYCWNHKCIRGGFCCSNNFCNGEITKEDIYRQLALIDTLYSTNVYRMRKFGLDEMMEVIWGLCKDANSNKHTLGILSKKLIATQPLIQELKDAFCSSYGYIQSNPAGKAPSLLSKYFYFVAIVCPQDSWGFPIYDKIVHDLLRPLEKFIGIKPLTQANKINQSSSSFDIDTYRAGLKRIIDVLESNNPTLWSTCGKQKFDLLDCFLWHIGKAKNNPYSILTKSEYLNGLVPQKIKNWVAIYDAIMQ